MPQEKKGPVPQRRGKKPRQGTGTPRPQKKGRITGSSQGGPCSKARWEGVTSRGRKEKRPSKGGGFPPHGGKNAFPVRLPKRTLPGSRKKKKHPKTVTNELRGEKGDFLRKDQRGGKKKIREPTQRLRLGDHHGAWGGEGGATFTCEERR